MSSAERTRAPSQSASGVEPVARGVLGAWILLAAEFFLLLLVESERLSGVWEVQSGAIGLLPSWLLLASFPGALGGYCYLLVTQSAKRGSARLALAIVFFVLAFLLGWGVGGGRHLATASARSGFAVCLGIIAFAAVFFGAPRLGRRLAGKQGASLYPVAGAALLAIFVLEAVNATVLVRLYPAFHGGLSVLSYMLAGAMWALRCLSGATEKRRSTAALGVLATGLLALALLVPASRFVAGFDNFRWVVSEASPSLSFGLDLSAQVAPPPALDESLASVPLGERRSQGGVDLRGRDILLISIDALRADHLGAYGYERATSPAIDGLARQGTLFEAAYAPTPHTSYSVTSLMTGKYMRPLLLQGAGEDSDLWATLLQSYDYRTAAFYPPAVFFIDTKRFGRFKAEKLGFEYAKIEFAEGDLRVNQFESYLGSVDSGRRVFTWVHLFGPHEPYEAHDKYPFGKRDIDLYDSEIRAADDTVGRLVRAARKRDPRTVVILTADHGEEFGDHGGRYHGTSVFDEQVRVPLLIDVPGVTSGKRVKEPVQTIDLLPTVLAGLQIPTPPRIRGRDLSALVAGQSGGLGRALAETDEYSLLAEGKYRLICGRRSGACRLYNIEDDPAQLVDISAKNTEVVAQMRQKAQALSETHGKYESQGLRAEGKGWPAPILRGISGDADVAPGLSRLLDDADATIRAKAAELLFHLATTGEAPALRLAMTREENLDARAYIALSLTRLGQGAPYVFELLHGGDQKYRRLAALALAEAGHDDGEKELIRWWADREALDHELSVRILRAFAKIRAKDALNVLIGSLKDVRLRPYIAETLGAIGDKDAKPFLAAQLLKERYRTARLPLARAIFQLGGDDELIVPLRRFLGVPERLEGGLGLAVEARILEDVGGPKPLERQRLQQLSDSGIRISVVVPPGPKDAPIRLILRVRSKSGLGGDVLVEPSSPQIALKKGQVRARNQPDIVSETALRIQVPELEAQKGTLEEQSGFVEVAATLPPRFRAKPGHHLALEIFAPRDIEIAALAAVPEREDLPPPPPEPWKKGDSSPEPEQTGQESSDLDPGHSP